MLNTVLVQPSKSNPDMTEKLLTGTLRIKTKYFANLDLRFMYSALLNIVLSFSFDGYLHSISNLVNSNSSGLEVLF